MKYFAGLMAVVVLVAGATFGAYQFWDHATQTRDDNGGVLTAGTTVDTVPANSPQLQADQVVVSGTISSGQFDGAALDPLPTPLTATAANRGTGGATFTPVEINGKTTSIDWQTGQPLPIAGDGGSLVLGAVTCKIGDGAITVLLDGVQALSPGTYSLKSSVAVGSQPRDSVSFTATSKTTVEFRDGITTPFPSDTLTTKGTGNVTLMGTLTVVHPNRTKTTATSITLQNGVFQISLKADGNGGYLVFATLQGATS